jgi:hypothetical protein
LAGAFAPPIRCAERIDRAALDGSASTTPAPVTGTGTPSAPSSATTTSPRSPPPARRAGSTSSRCCAPATATTS